jgi:hypothetical protein
LRPSWYIHAGQTCGWSTRRSKTHTDVESSSQANRLGRGTAPGGARRNRRPVRSRLRRAARGQGQRRVLWRHGDRGGSRRRSRRRAAGVGIGRGGGTARRRRQQRAGRRAAGIGTGGRVSAGRGRARPESAPVRWRHSTVSASARRRAARGRNRRRHSCGVSAARRGAGTGGPRRVGAWARSRGGGGGVGSSAAAVTAGQRGAVTARPESAPVLRRQRAVAARLR